jgi:hypothetical protein
MTPETKIKISRNGINKAEYQLWQIAGLITEGDILSSDHYWHEGMIAWKKVSESDIITQSINAKKKLEEIELKTKKAIQREQDEMKELKELFEKSGEIVTQVISGLIGVGLVIVTMMV